MLDKKDPELSLSCGCGVYENKFNWKYLQEIILFYVDRWLPTYLLGNTCVFLTSAPGKYRIVLYSDNKLCFALDFISKINYFEQSRKSHWTTKRYFH